MIKTSQGPMDEAQMERTDGVIDDETRFCPWTEFRVPGTTEAYRREGGFAKVNAFAGAPVAGPIPIDEQDGSGIQNAEASDLERRIGTIDNDNEFTSWVEYRRPGSDKVVHRSVDVKAKKMPATAPSGAGAVNGGAPVVAAARSIEDILGDGFELAQEHTERITKELGRTSVEICRAVVDALSAAGHAGISVSVDWNGADQSFVLTIRK